MASHAGMEYVLKTRYGYVNKDGNFVTDIKEALEINFIRFGFGPSAYQVYERLGFDKSKITEDDIKFYVTKPSYDSRISQIGSILSEIGYDFENVIFKSSSAFSFYHLDNYDNFISYMEELNKKLRKFYEGKEVDKTISYKDKKIKLWIVDENKNREYCNISYYSDLGKIMEYSFNLKKLNISKYFDLSIEEKEYYDNFQNNGLLEYLIKEITNNKFDLGLSENFEIINMAMHYDKLNVYFNEVNFDLINFLNKRIRDYYYEREIHITRMFGSYILLVKENGELKALKATPIPIKYCPLMIKLLKEVGGKDAEELIETLKIEDLEKQEEAMCNLINEVVIKGGYFDDNRPLNSCEANVLFGASETMSSAFKNEMIDAAVIVSNNMGTIITTNSSNTQGAVKRMTGLFYTTPSKEVIDNAVKANIKPIFPFTGKIDQLEGVKEAIKLGYKNIAVSVAAGDNYLHSELKKLEKDGVRIYKFGLCSTGIDKKTAEIMQENADVIWSCASQYVKEIIEPNAIAQVGVKIPVHIMTKNGWEIIGNHLLEMDKNFSDSDIELKVGEEKPVCINQRGKVKVLKKEHLRKCNDCPNPCV